MSLFFVLLESAIVHEVEANFEWLLLKMKDVIANGDPTDRPYQEFMSNILSVTAQKTK
jgi:hypothetical protein